jgi:endo-1,4-beta-xylanase
VLRPLPACLAEAEYSAVLGSEFSQLQPEIETKFGPIHPRPDSDPDPYQFNGADKLVAFAQSHSMLVRGHTLVWHGQVPDWRKKGGYSAPQLAAILESHIRHIHAVIGYYASKV